MCSPSTQDAHHVNRHEIKLVVRQLCNKPGTHRGIQMSSPAKMQSNGMKLVSLLLIGVILAYVCLLSTLSQSMRGLAEWWSCEPGVTDPSVMSHARCCKQWLSVSAHLGEPAVEARGGHALRPQPVRGQHRRHEGLRSGAGQRREADDRQPRHLRHVPLEPGLYQADHLWQRHSGDRAFSPFKCRAHTLGQVGVRVLGPKLSCFCACCTGSAQAVGRYRRSRRPAASGSSSLPTMCI